MYYPDSGRRTVVPRHSKPRGPPIGIDDVSIEEGNVDGTRKLTMSAPGSTSIMGAANDDTLGSARFGFGWRQRSVNPITRRLESG